MEKFKITIGSRGSDLALWQAHHVKDRLIGLGADVEIKIFKKLINLQILYLYNNRKVY